MKLRYPLIIALCSTLSSAAVLAEEQAATEDNDNVLMSVNDFKVTPEVYQAYRGLRQRPEPRDPQQAQLQILNELVTILMISQDAEANGIDKKPEHAAILDLGRRMALSEAAVQDVIAGSAITDEAIQKVYDEKYKEMPKEYKARHILVKEEDKAKELIAELGTGADFGELAKANSTDGSAATGGDLGWFTPDRMVKPFSEAVVAQEVGKFSAEPVKSQFGYHIVLVDEVRDQEPPAMDTVRAQLAQEIRQQTVNGYVEDVRKRTNIEVKGQQLPANPPAAEASQEAATK